MPETGRLKLLQDTAWGEFEGERRLCGLGFIEYAKALASVARNTEGPFTIGIFGSWGTGKTSLMRRVKFTLDKPDEENDLVTVWFNAWQFERDEHPIIPLIATIVNELEKEKGVLKEIREKLIHALRAVARGINIKAKANLGFVEGEIGIDGKDISDKAEELAKPILDQSLYQNAFDKLSEATKDDDGLRVVVFIDDLDRCLLEGALKILQSIKLVLAQPNFIFFLGLDRNIIKAYLEKLFMREYEVENFSGDEYLNKLVQLSFPIPSHKERIKEFANDIYKLIEMQFDEKAKEGFGEILPILGAACNANPRSVIRLINNVLVDWAIAWESYETEKIPLAAFAISRALQERERWKKIFNFLIQRSNNVIGNWVLLYIENFDNLDERAEILREWENEDPRSAEQIPKLIEDEEDLQKLLNSNPGRIYLSDHEIRKACAQLSRMPTSESTASDEPVELRETWPWADDFTPDDWPMYKDYQIRPNANLIGVNLAGVDLRRADLRNANLTEANLAGVNLEGAKLQGSNLQGAHLERSNLRWTDLGGSNLRWTDLTAADLEGANLLWADVTRASLKSTNLRKAKLPGSVEEIRKICDCDEKTIWPEESESQYKIL